MAETAVIITRTYDLLKSSIPMLALSANFQPHAAPYRMNFRMLEG